jgi:flagellar protein FliJ
MFRFRFEALLTQRRHAEETRQKELSDARRVLSGEQSALAELKNRLRSGIRELHRRQTQRFRPVDMQLHMAHIAQLERSVEAQRKRVGAAHRQVGQRRQALIEAVQKRKILEKLKEKDCASHERVVSERERKFIDEMASRAASRKGDRI